MNGNGRNNHYKLGDEIGKIKARLSKLEGTLQIVRATISDNHWDFIKKCVEKREEFQKGIMDFLEKDIKLNFLGDHTDI